MHSVDYTRVGAGERRQLVDGSIVYEGTTSRLRVVRASTSLGITIDVFDSAGSCVPLIATPLGSDLELIEEDGAGHIARFASFEALYRHGTISGIMLCGLLRASPITLTIHPDQAGSCYHIHIRWENPHPLPCRRLAHSWRLAPEYLPVQMRWPAEAGVVCSPLQAAFVQTDTYYCGLAPDPEEATCAALGARVVVDDDVRLESGVLPAGEGTATTPTGFSFAYTLSVDGRAQPGRGFQLLARQLGRSGALACAVAERVQSGPGVIPPLPQIPAARDWSPCHREGSPAEIAALARHYLSLAEQGDLYHLDTGLCWVDRLCLEQQVYEVPGGIPTGHLGSGPEWETVNRWAPELFFDAFRLSGRAEYIARGLAAFAALPENSRGALFTRLWRRYGDIYLHADFQEAIALGQADTVLPVFTEDGIELLIDTSIPRPRRLVIEGSRERYSLRVNGVLLGHFPSEELRAGITWPPAPPN
ncbi:MAG: hypothetical protein ACYC7E_12995 [Armatimonadota bacterium]